MFYFLNKKVEVADKLKALTIVKEGTPQLNTEGKREFKMVLLTEGYKLTKNSQHTLRRTMKKYMATCRVILVTQLHQQGHPCHQVQVLGTKEVISTLPSLPAGCQNSPEE